MFKVSSNCISFMNRSAATLGMMIVSAVLIAAGLGAGKFCSNRGLSVCGSFSEPPRDNNPGGGGELAEGSELFLYKGGDPYPIEVGYSDDLWTLNVGDEYPPSQLTGTRDLIQLIAKTQSEVGYKTNVIFKVEQISAGAFGENQTPTLLDYGRNQKRRIDQLGTFRVEQHGSLNLNGEEAYQIVYAGNDGKHTLKRKRIIVKSKRALNSTYFHLVTYTAAVDKYERNVEAFESILDSINLI